MIRLIARLLLIFQLLCAALFSLLIYNQLLPEHGAASLMLGFAAVLLVRLLITANSFVLSRRYRSPAPQHAQLSWLNAVRLFLIEFISSMQSSSWTMAFRTFEKRPVPNPRSLPVLLIHGYGCNSGYWHSMSRALLKASISHHAVSLEPVFAPIERYLPSLQKAIYTLMQDSNSTRIILIGHSMGGLVCRAYLREYGINGIAKVITIGTPHHGTALANRGIGDNVQQMATTCDGATATSSQWIQSLERSEAATTRALITSIYSHHDNIISPQVSGHLDEATNIALAGIGHVTLAMHKRLQQEVIQIVLSAE